MSHGVERKLTDEKPLSAEHFESLIKIAAELGHTSINYNDLSAWRNGTGELPTRPIMFDFDHPVKVMREEVHTILSRYGFAGNLFINTGMMDPEYDSPWPREDFPVMTWEEIGELMELGWHIGAHTVTHPNLSKLSQDDPSGQKLRDELETCNATIEKYLGITPVDFAYTGTSFSTVAEREVSKLYRFGRLWIVRSHYQADGETIRYADLAGAEGEDEPDGGPPEAARYITKETPAYRLPSMEIQGLLYTPEAFRRYLENAA